jgi:ribosomal-protein-alanine N-acetyltransferase
VANIVLRSYRASDLDAIVQMDEACFAEPFQFSHDTMRRFAEARRARVVIAEAACDMAGFGIVHVERAGAERVGYMVTLDVDERFRRQGVGQLLIEEMERQAAKAKCAALWLHVFEGNEAAIRFYERAGYRRVKKTAAFYGNGLNAWSYEKRPLG